MRGDGGGDDGAGGNARTGDAGCARVVGGGGEGAGGGGDGRTAQAAVVTGLRGGTCACNAHYPLGQSTQGRRMPCRRTPNLTRTVGGGAIRIWTRL